MSKTRKKAAPVPSAKAPDTLEVKARPDDTEEAALARTALRPTVLAALSVRDFDNALGDLSITALVDALSEQCRNVSGGDLGRAEAILAAQAHTLDAIFNNLARRSAANLGEYLNAAETYLRLALKAQAQCRATLEALAEIKNPRPVAFVKQANIAHGPQQVNNGSPAPAHARTEDSENQPNELLAVKHEQGERLDPGAAATAGGSNPELAAVGAQHRT